MLSLKQIKGLYWNWGIYWYRGAYWNKGAYSIGALMRMAALINKNKFKGGAY